MRSMFDNLFGSQNRVVTDKKNLNIELDELLYILSSRRRRLTLRVLYEYHEDVMRFRDACNDVARIIYKNPQQKDYKAIYVSLYQSHMPSMRDAGMVEYDDQEDGNIRITDEGKRVYETLVVLQNIIE